jgi:alkanesulfonate monooxygenase
LAGERTSFHGRYFDIDDYVLRPAPRFRPRPSIYVGGESEPAQELAHGLADVWFLNGKPVEEVARLTRQAGARTRSGDSLRFALSAFVIARPTAREANDELAYLSELAEGDAAEVTQLFGNADKKSVMLQASAATPHVGTNGGTAAGLVGSYDDVADRILRFHEAGIELFMLQFQPFEAEMRRFAHEVRPRVARLTKVAV